MLYYKPKAYNSKIASIQSKKLKENMAMIVFGVLLMQTAVLWDLVIAVISTLSFPHRYVAVGQIE